MVLQAKGEFTDKTGTRLGLDKKIYVHHIIIADAGRGMTMAPLMPLTSQCPAGASGTSHSGGMGGMGHMKSLNKRFPQGFNGATGNPAPSLMLAKGNEGDTTVFSSVNDTVKSGYWIGKDDPLLLMTEVVNYQNEPQEVYFTVDMDYLSFPSGPPKEYLDVRWGMLQVACSTTGLALRPPKDKPITFETPIYRAGADGYIVGAYPHLHDGALDMKIMVNGKAACSSDAIYGGDGGTTVDGQKWQTITGYSPCLGGIQVHKNDNISMIANYDLTKHRL
ncbi:hypothetical protein BT63DRAFT_199949 [Microthyrium microscopicum]|uniref:Uncharacterized protein n=1 Tax=Microthyrium microscopicum TaxID=703497 RepID=A0A6A6UGD9_9PEZI|nr:hypothetical protein BT63DRAFT_199949 [Microthyrium microscopicum]